MNIIIDNEIALHKFETRTNQDEVLRLLHPDFQEVGLSGNSYNLESIINLLGKELPTVNWIHSQDFQSIELAPDVCLLLYMSVTVNPNGNLSRFAKRSSIWVLGDQGWQMKYHQGTPCKPFTIRL